MSPFKSKFGLMSYRKYPPRSLPGSLEPLFPRDKVRGNTYYIRLGRGLYPASHLRATPTFSLRVVYGVKCSTDFLLLLSPL